MNNTLDVVTTQVSTFDERERGEREREEIGGGVGEMNVYTIIYTV